MLTQIADGVLIHKSEFVQSNAVVVLGASGALLIDPGVLGDELDCLANDLSGLGQSVVAGFSTHPHWDHLLWHARFGQAPRYGTARCSQAAREALTQGIDAREHGIPEEVPLELLGLITGLPDGATQVPWDGTSVRIIEHQAHAVGHAALLIEDRGVLVAGDMLSDILIPLLDFGPTADPIDDYRAALRLFDDVIGDVDVLVPGHGSVAVGDEVRARITQDLAYVDALRDASDVVDARLSADYGKDWLPGVDASQRENLARRGERGAAPDALP